MRSAYHHRLHHLTDFFCFVVVALATGRGRLIHRRIYLTRSIIIMQNYNCFSMSHKHSWHVQFMCWKLTVLWTPTLVPDLADCTPFWTTKRRICPWVATYPFYSNRVHLQKPVETFTFHFTRTEAILAVSQCACMYVLVFRVQNKMNDPTYWLYFLDKHSAHPTYCHKISIRKMHNVKSKWSSLR